MNEFLEALIKNKELILTALEEHIQISFLAIALGIIVALPMGVLLTFNKRLASIVLGIFGVINTIPSLVLLGIAMIFLGLGFVPAVAVLFVYSLLPIMRATYTGLVEVDKKYIKAARGMGMSRLQILRLVQIPLAMPSIITGIRLSSVYIISWATLSAFIGAGGLGDLIWMGLQSYDFNLVFCGAIPTTILAFCVSILMNILIRYSERRSAGEVRS